MSQITESNQQNQPNQETQSKFSHLVLDFATLNKLIIKDLNESMNSSKALRKYKKEDVINFLQNPEKSEKQLREISLYLYNNSAHYRRIVHYFANLLTFDYYVKPYDLDISKVNIDLFKKQYNKILHILDTMNLKHEFNKILKVAFRDDVFYGYEHSNRNSYFIQSLDPDYCRISSIEDGVFNYAFDFSYFDKNKKKLDQYPIEFTKKYEIYLKDRKNKWIELDSKNTICIKINEDLDYPIPPFSNIFEAVFDIEEYKELKKAKTKIDNYAVIIHKIPMQNNSNEPNAFMIDFDKVVYFHNKASEALPEEVGLITTPMDTNVVKFEKDKVGNDNVAQAERDLYNLAGVSQLLFNSDKSSVGLNKSVITDEQVAFSVLRQLERWVNRKLKMISGTYKFKVSFLDITVFNRDTMFDRLLKSAQYGFPTKLMAGISLGMSQLDVNNLMFLENNVLELHDKFIPLSSSHTTSSKDGAGANKKSDDELTESGIKTRDTEGNEKRNGD